MEKHQLAKSLIEKLCPTAKSVFVGRMGSVIVTFRGECPARNAAYTLAPVLKNIKIAQGFDPGISTDMKQGRRLEVPVWRIGGNL